MPTSFPSQSRKDSRLVVALSTSLHHLCFQDPATPHVSPSRSPPENGLDKARGLKKDAPTSPASVASSSSTPSSKTKDLGHVCGVCPGTAEAGRGLGRVEVEGKGSGKRTGGGPILTGRQMGRVERTRVGVWLRFKCWLYHSLAGR